MPSPETLEKLQSYLPLRIVLCLREGKALGLTEHSFSLGTTENRVRLWWSGKAIDNLFGAEHQLDAIKTAAANAKTWRGDEFIFDPLDPNCPVEVDFEGWLAAQGKFDKRNAFFRLKPFGEYVLRAMKAEFLVDQQKGLLENFSQTLEEGADRQAKLKALLLQFRDLCPEAFEVADGPED